MSNFKLKMNCIQISYPKLWSHIQITMVISTSYKRHYKQYLELCIFTLKLHRKTMLLNNSKFMYSTT